MTQMRGADETHVALLDAALFDSRFELVRPLRTGNGVNTYLAVDSDSSEAVVVKTIDRALVPQGVRIRFEHETAVLRRLSGLGLGRLIDAGQTGDRLFLVQEFLPGQTLAKLLDGGPLPVATAMRIGRDVAAALDIAHSASICHRDVNEMTPHMSSITCPSPHIASHHTASPHT